jgi:hypothetical protein
LPPIEVAGMVTGVGVEVMLQLPLLQVGVETPQLPEEQVGTDTTPQLPEEQVE